MKLNLWHKFRFAISLHFFWAKFEHGNASKIASDFITAQKLKASKSQSSPEQNIEKKKWMECIVASERTLHLNVIMQSPIGHDYKSILLFYCGKCSVFVRQEKFYVTGGH